ncbi:MAG TPA: HAD family hydrolase [Thermopetrobacter sp.]|nr:HAD family hydrolase [Thermopetrobacter sp.]
MTLKAIIFDVDGTLAETEEAHRVAFNEEFAAWDLPWEWDRDLYAELLAVTGGRERIRHYIERYAPPKAETVRERIAELHRAKSERYMKMIAEGAVPLRPGVARLIDEAKAAGLKVGVATTTSTPNVEVLIEATLGRPARDVFDALACGEEVERKKPAPDLYELALDKLGVSHNEAMAIEDSRNGLYAALRAGVPVIITPSGYTAEEDFTDALAVVSHLGEPDMPYEHLSGLGWSRTMITPSMLARWIDGWAGRPSTPPPPGLPV